MKKNKLIYSAAFLLSLFLNTFSANASDDDQMTPYVCEKDVFSYNGSSSNQITPLALTHMDKSFIEQTGGADQETKFKRATGSVELLILVRGAQQGKNVKDMTDPQKKQYVQDEMVKELKKIGKSQLQAQYTDANMGYLDFDTLSIILEKVKSDIQKNAKPNCTVQ